MEETNSQALLEIDLDIIAENYNFLKTLLDEKTRLAAVVKADSYGLGSKIIAKKLYGCGCRQFYVSYFNEAIQLEKMNDAEIYVLHGFAGTTPDEFLDTNIVPVLNSIEDIKTWQTIAGKMNKKLPAIIHIDTGMNRLGVDVKDIPDLVKMEIDKSFDIKYIMSHLACAEEKHNPKNKEQLEKFKFAVKALGIKAPLSFANSSGIFLGKDYHFNQVRPGAALYGINPEPDRYNPMKAVVSLKAKILQTRAVEKGETVGYGCSYVVQKPSKLATIAAGYADGFFRVLGEHGLVYFKGVKARIVGKVSMDAIVVNVTAVKPEPKVGDWAEIIGENQTVDDVASNANTIGYEVFTALGSRYKRVYKG